ncbi:MAG: AraC family transcriptional regulator [Pseudohongiellaceae bacterium]
MKEHFEWLVDRNIRDETGDSTRIDIKQEGLELKLERLSYGPSAVVFCKVQTRDPFPMTLADSATEESDQALTYIVNLSGYSTGKLLNGSKFVLDKTWGILADFSDGSAEFVSHPGETIRSFSGAFAINTLSDLLGEDYEGAGAAILREMSDNPGALISSFRISPQIRLLASSAWDNTQLAGPLRRLFMEGVSLQILALILDQRQSVPLLGRPAEIKVIAHKNAIRDAAELLLSDLGNPPTIAQLSAMSGLSARQLNAGFRQIFGYSVFNFLCENRLLSAKELLIRQPDFPLKVLASKMGYAHPNNFIAAFKRKYGIPPRQYAKLHRH